MVDTPGRVLLVSSSRSVWVDGADVCDLYAHEPYSVGAILYHLHRRGWVTCSAGWRTSRNPRALARVIDSFKPTVVYTYGALIALNPLLCRRFLCAWKTFVVVHGWDDLYGDIWADLFGWPGRFFMNFFERLIVTASDRVITLSYFLRERGRKWGVTCLYIPNGADPPPPVDLSKGIRLDGAMKLVYTGDQARWKRTADICEAMRHVPGEIKLYLTGGHYAYLDAYASGNCVFLGFLPKDEQYRVMAQADVFVVTSDQDCNAKLQEYLVWKKPILGYDGRANLFFKNGRNAWLTRDYPAAIMRLYRDPQLREELARHAAEDIPVYRWSEIAEQFDAAFRSFVSEKPPSQGN